MFLHLKMGIHILRDSKIPASVAFYWANNKKSETFCEPTQETNEDHKAHSRFISRL